MPPYLNARSISARFMRMSLILLTLCIPCLAQSSRQKIYDLPLPRPAGPDEELVARVSAGPLKIHQRIVVRIRNGEIAGNVSPFGAQARQTPGVYTIPLPAAAVRDGAVRLLVEIEEKNIPPRAPTADEVRNITLAYIPASGTGSKE